jgi:PAS domain S-box-containing protein
VWLSRVDESLGLICTHDLNGTMLSVNPASAELLGYQPDELIGRNGRDFLEPSVRHIYDAYLEQIRQQPMVSELMQVVTKSHEVRTWLYRNVLQTRLLRMLQERERLPGTSPHRGLSTRC